MSEPKNISLSPVFFVILFTGCYWLYLAIISQMIIFHDSIGYERLGRLLYTHGWTEYFKQGPSREPFYPFLISISMHLANIIPISFQMIQKFIQLFFLFTTQILLLTILRTLKINQWIIALILLYFGVSPAIVNSSLCLYSEVATFPFMLVLLLTLTSCWRKSHQHVSSFKLLFSTLLLSLTLLTLTFTKGIFQLIVPLILIPFFISLIHSLIKKKQAQTFRLITFFLGFSLIFYGSLNLYKLMNKKYNGSYTLTNRGARALYGNTARRMQPLTFQSLLAATSYAAGAEVCHDLFDEKSCDFWAHTTSDNYSAKKMGELLNKNFSFIERNKTFTSLSIKEALKNPLQYALFCVIEGSKMLFWEKTKVLGYVVYPLWHSNLYQSRIFHYSLSFCIAFISFFALIVHSRKFYTQRNNLLHIEKSTKESSILIFFTLVIIVSYSISHSFFYVMPRYVYPLGPTYLILIAYLFYKRPVAN